MKLLAFISLGLVGCSLPAPPPSGNSGEFADASVDPPGEDDDDGADDGIEPDLDAGPSADASSPGQVLKQTVTDVINPQHSITCRNDGRQAELSFLRVFDLGQAGTSSTFRVSKVTVGVESALGGGDGVQQVDVRLHSLIGTGELLGQNLQLVATTSKLVPDLLGERVEFPIEASIASTSRLVVEVHSPDASQSGDAFFIGANDDGQTAPGYIWAPACDDEDDDNEGEPHDLSDIGFSDVHILIEVTGR